MKKNLIERHFTSFETSFGQEVKVYIDPSLEELVGLGANIRGILVDEHVYVWQEFVEHTQLARTIGLPLERCICFFLKRVNVDPYKWRLVMGLVTGIVNTENHESAIRKIMSSPSMKKIKDSIETQKDDYAKPKQKVDWSRYNAELEKKMNQGLNQQDAIAAVDQDMKNHPQLYFKQYLATNNPQKFSYSREGD